MGDLSKGTVVAVTALRRTALAIAAALPLLGLVGPGSQAATGYLPYTCTLPVLGDKTFQMDSDTTAPSPFYLGTAMTPKLVTKSQVPADLANLATESLDATSVDGTFVSTIKVNGQTRTVTQPVARRSIPANTSSPVLITATGVLPKLTAAPGATVTYLPGNIKVTLRFYKANGSSAGEFKNMPCTMPASSRTIDTVVYVKSPSTVTPTVTYAAAAKKITAVAKVTAKSKVVPTGKVTAVLFRGTTKLKTLTLTLSGGKVTAGFTGIKAGTYKVVLTYLGNGVVNRSTATRSITVR